MSEREIPHVRKFHRQGYRLHLTNTEESVWRVTFSRAPLLAEDGFGAGATPWRAVQVAAWNALGKATGDTKGSTPAEDVTLP